MPYALRFDGVNDVVTIPNGMSGNIGTSAYSFRVKSAPSGITVPATLNRGFIGASLASASGLVVTSGGLIEVWRVGTRLYGSAAQLIFTGVEFDYTLSHLADGTWTITNNLTSTVTDNGTYTNNITWSGSGVLNQLGKNSANANNSCLAGDIALIAVTGLVNADTWDADLSGGSGSVWPSVSGTNNGTLVNFSVPSCWIFYSSGASNTVTVSATLPKITGTLTLNEINPSYVISVSGQLPKITGAVALNEINPVFTVAVAGQLPKLTGSIALNQFANNRQVTVNGVLPKLTGAVTLNRIQPNNQVAVSGQLPRITASITLRVPDSYPTASPNDYTVSAYLSTNSTYTARLSESSTINAIISTETTYAARLN